jgi:hypothetical protein
MRYLILKKRKALGEPDAPKVGWLTAIGSHGQTPLLYEFDAFEVIGHSQRSPDSFAAHFLTFTTFATSTAIARNSSPNASSTSG